MDRTKLSKKERLIFDEFCEYKSFCLLYGFKSCDYQGLKAYQDYCKNNNIVLV